MSEEDMKFANAEARLREYNESDRKKRKKTRPNIQTPISPIKFGSNLFPGGKKKTRKQKKSRKSRKSRKKTRRRTKK